jgi:hypothetical protein
MKRSKFNLSNYKLMTGDMGYLYPVQVQEIIPGDSLKAHSAALIRVNPLLAPVMHPVTVRIHHWFVPHRHVWDGDKTGDAGTFEDFITGGPDGADTQVVPTLTTDATPGTLLDYLGIPPTAGINVSALPVRCINKIFNEWYRDQDLVDARDLNDTSVPQCAWQKDYLTTSRPFPQKGPQVTLPIADKIPLAHDGDANSILTVGAPGIGSEQYNLNSGGSYLQGSDNQTGGDRTPLYADGTQAEAVDVNDFRRAFALQRYQEARMRFGSRYSEYVRYLGVNPADSRLQRPEYLGGGRTVINFSEVLATADSEDTNIGDLKGHGIAAVKTRNFIRHFNEHGYFISLMSVRPKTMYQDGIHRTFLRQTKEDFWQRELQMIGQQTIYRNEVFADAANGTETFGYQDRYSDYKRIPSNVAGEFRDILDYWHMGRKFESPPALNAEFVQCDATKRIHATQNEHALWCMVQNNVRARRLLSKSAASRIV